MTAPVGTEAGGHPPGRWEPSPPVGSHLGTIDADPPRGGCEAPRVPPFNFIRLLAKLRPHPAALGNLLNCNSCCRAKSQQKPFSGGAFPVQSHRCHSPRPLLLCVSPPPHLWLSWTPPPPPWAASPAPIPPSRRCELRVRAGEKAPAQGLGWVFWGFGFFFFSLRGTGFCWLTLPCNSKLWDWGDPWGSLFFFAVPVVKGPVAAAGRRHLLLRIPEMHFGRSPAVGCLVIAPVQEGVKPFPRGAAAGVQDPAQHPRGSLLLVGTRWLPSIAGFPRLW